MKEFKDKVAVVTGAASGIGRAIATHCMNEGMKVVLADIERDALSENEKEMKSVGATVLAVPTDVSKAEDIEALVQKTFEVFESVHLLFNNAGVGVGGLIWENTIADWKWVLGINLWGVIHGIRFFVPRMIEQNTEGHIVNTASLAGLISAPFQGVYNISKQSVVALSESLYHDLALVKSKIKVSVLCPGFVKTRVMDCERNRPVELENNPAEVKTRSEFDFIVQNNRKAFLGGVSPDHVANLVFNAIREEKFYIHTHPELKNLIQDRMEDILQERNPKVPL